jgi:hypothetical protein
MTFHALVSLPQRLSAERHVSLVLAAAAELTAFVLTYLLVSSRCGRRGPLCAAQLLVGGACLSIGVFALLQPQPSRVQWIGKWARGRVSFVPSILIFFPRFLERADPDLDAQLEPLGWLRDSLSDLMSSWKQVCQMGQRLVSFFSALYYGLNALY